MSISEDHSQHGQHVLHGVTEVIKNLSTIIFWCLILAIYSMLFYDQQSIVIAGSVECLPCVMAILLILWPWTSLVISGVMVTIDSQDDNLKGYTLGNNTWLQNSCVSTQYVCTEGDRDYSASSIPPLKVNTSVQTLVHSYLLWL